jgi:hypothetical protein
MNTIKTLAKDIQINANTTKTQTSDNKWVIFIYSGKETKKITKLLKRRK